MRSVAKLVFILTFVFLALTACGPVTAVPSVTPTATVTVTATATRRPIVTATPSEIMPTSQPTASIRLLDQLPPSQPVDKYELVPWNESLPVTLDKIRGAAASEDSHYDGLVNKYRAAFLSEAWLHTQSDDEKEAALCNVVYDAPGSKIFPVLRPGQDLFSFYVEDLLNSNHFPVERLSEPFEDAFGLPGCLEALLVTGAGNISFEPTSIHNLFGDGQDAYVFAVGTVHGNNRLAIYAAHSIDGMIHVEKVRDWEEYFPISSGYDFRFANAGDNNGNGYNELMVDVKYGASGLPGWAAEWLYWYEWQPGKGTFIGSDKIDILAHDGNLGLDAGKWFVSRTNIPGTITVTAHEFLYIPYAVTNCAFSKR